MKFKKALPRAPVVLSAEERRLVIQFVGILVEVDQRVGVKSANARCRKNQCVSANKRKASEEKGTRLKQKQKNKVRNICGPCFLNQIIYHESVNCMRGIFTQRDSHDRYHSFNIH